MRWWLAGWLWLLVCRAPAMAAGGPGAHDPAANPPPEMRSESAVYLQRRLGQWTQRDATERLGQPTGHRLAYNDRHAISGDIVAFPDPTGRYRRFELVFDHPDGKLRTIYVYPWKMTWQECRELWGASVSSIERPDHSRFYSYLKRHLDVLVDRHGNVINFGLY